MRKQDKVKLDVLDAIDEQIVERTANERYRLSNKRRRILPPWLIPTVSAVAAACLIVTTSLMLLPMLFGKQVPVYTGMTVQNEAPMSVTLYADSLSAEMSYALGEGSNGHGNAYGHDKQANQEDPYERGEAGEQIEDAIEEALSPEMLVSEAEYFSKKNEDVYFMIHIHNPDDFEILSFTLNGTKYSSYMFEEGSDMETLILRYNVGDVEGVQHYTIDAIKYIDGTEIKDVLMDGERTVTVNITPENQPTATVSDERADCFAIGFTPMLSDTAGLVEASDGKLYALLYDGETIVGRKEVASGEATLFDRLKPNTLYQYAVVALYDAMDGQGVRAHLLYKRALYTDAVMTLQNVAIDGLEVTFEMAWSDAYEGEKRLDSLALYDGETKIRELAPTATRTGELMLDKTYTLKATYTADGRVQSFAEEIEAPKASVGLARSGELITGIGSCTDTVLYLNSPIGARAFVNHPYITEVYLGRGVTSLGEEAFFACESLWRVGFSDAITETGTATFGYNSNLTSLSLGNGIKTIGDRAFANCPALQEIVIPDSVTTIDDSAFVGCYGAVRVTLGKNLQVVKELAFWGIDALEVYNRSALTVKVGDASSLGSLGANVRYVYQTGESRLSVENDWCLYRDDKAVIAVKYLGEERDVVIPDGVTEIWAHVCLGRDDITSVVMPDTVTSVGNFAFQSCTALTSVRFSERLKEIGEAAFGGTGLTTLRLPSSVTAIGDFAFAGCYSLDAVYVPIGVTKMGNYVFEAWYRETPTVIYCAASTRPQGWSEEWFNNNEQIKVVWGSSLA